MSDNDYQVCQCIRIGCWHPKGKCDEPPTIRGGICTSCRYVRTHSPEADKRRQEAQR